MRKVTQMNSPRKASFGNMSFGSAEKMLGRKSSSESMADTDIADYHGAKVIWAAKACQAGFRGYMARKRVQMLIEQQAERSAAAKPRASDSPATPLSPSKIMPSSSSSSTKTRPR